MEKKQECKNHNFSFPHFDLSPLLPVAFFPEVVEKGINVDADMGLFPLFY